MSDSDDDFMGIICRMGSKTKAFLSNVEETCPELVQPSWRPDDPLHCKVATKPPVFHSKFGGPNPWLSDSYTIPVCKNGHPMSFLCQIDIASLPEQLKIRLNLWDGLFQLFMCVKEDNQGCDTDKTRFNEVRIIPQSDLPNDSLLFLSAVACKDHDISGLPVLVQEYVRDLWKTAKKRGRKRKDAPKEFQENLVGSWTKNKMLEIPTYNELYENGPALAKLGLTPPEMLDMNFTFRGGLRYYEAKEVPKIRSPGGDYSCIKLGGWIEWRESQFPCQYPKCPDCTGAPQMDICFLRFSVGTDGDTGFVTLCSKCHKPALFFL